jgi:hypothetical protein
MTQKRRVPNEVLNPSGHVRSHLAFGPFNWMAELLLKSVFHRFSPWPLAVILRVTAVPNSRLLSQFCLKSMQILADDRGREVRRKLIDMPVPHEMD